MKEEVWLCEQMYLLNVGSNIYDFESSHLSSVTMNSCQPMLCQHAMRVNFSPEMPAYVIPAHCGS